MASTITSPRRLPSDPPEPDLSHLTAEERKIIQDVLQRQKAEEQKDQNLINNLEQDVKRLEANIKKQIQQTVGDAVGLGSTSNDDTCRICNKVKFVGSAGYTCHYCQLRSCSSSRCGGRLTLKSKSIWACNLCRKKQELALKSGQWCFGPKGQGLQRKGSLARQSSLSSDNEGRAGRHRSRDMMVGGAAKRSSSAHALMETDRMDEYGNHNRNRTRKPSGELMDKRSNGDVSRPIRLRGEMETTPFIIPKSKPSVSLSRTSLPSMHKNEDIASSHSQMAPSKPAASSPSKTAMPNSLGSKPTPSDTYDSRQQQPATTLSAESSRSRSMSLRVSPHSDKMPAGGSDTGSSTVVAGSSSSSRQSDTSRHSQERLPSGRPQATPSSDIIAHGIDPHRHRDPDHRHRDPDHRHREPDHWHRDPDHSSGSRPPSRNLNQKREEVSSDRLSDVSHVSHLSRQNQRPDPAPRRVVPEPAARHSRATPTEEYDVHRGILPTRTGISGNGGRERHPSSEYRSGNEVDGHRSVVAVIPHAAGDEIQYGGTQGPSPEQRGRHAAFDTERKVSDASNKRRGAMLSQNSSQESNSTNTSNKLAVPNMAAHSYKDNQYDDGVKSARSRRREMAMLQTDSLSSDPSDCVRPPPPKPHKHRKAKNNGSTKHNNSSVVDRVRDDEDLSSSEEEMRSTTSCGDDLESESVISEKAPSTYYNEDDGEPPDSEVIIKENNIKNFLRHPNYWRMSNDGRSIIGHLLLKKKRVSADGRPIRDSGGILGLRVVGGKMTDEGQLGAFISGVMDGSIADTKGNLRKGDEVTEWNGRSLKGATYDEVTEIILESKQEPTVELFVRRLYDPNNLPPKFIDREDRCTNPLFDSRPSLTITSAESPGLTRRLMSVPHITGKIQLNLMYHTDKEELLISVISASELPLVEGNQPPQAYCKLLLLPDDSETTRYVTRPATKTREPEWRQTFSYKPISRSEFVEHSIEVTVWNRKKNANSNFLGEIVIELETAKLTNESLWYRLRQHEELSGVPQHKPISTSSLGTSSVGGRSRSSRKGMSDTGSEISELDMEEDYLKPDTTLDHIRDLIAHHHRDDSIHHGRERHGGVEMNRSPHHHQSHHTRRPTPNPGLHSSREDFRLSSGPSPTPRRRQLPNIPPQQGAMIDRDVAHQGRMGRGQNPHEMGRGRNPQEEAMNDGFVADNRDMFRNPYHNTGNSEDETFMSDASEISDFSMRSTQSERPPRSRKLSEFRSGMKHRVDAGRRQVMPHSAGPSYSGSPSNIDSHELGSMSDSGLMTSLTDRRVTRIRMNSNGAGKHQPGYNQYNMHDGYGRQRMTSDDSGLHLQNRNQYRLNKQTSRDSTDGSVCSVSSDSSNAKQVFAHLSERIEGLKRNHYDSPEIANGFDHSRRDSNISNASDASSMSDFRRDSDVSLRSDSSPRSASFRRSSCTSVASSLYEDDMALARMTESQYNQAHQYDQQFNDPSTLNPNDIGYRLNELATQRVAAPRRLQVNEIVAAASNPNLFALQAQKDPTKSSASHNPSFQGSSAFLGSSNLLSTNIHGNQLQKSTEPKMQFPFTNGPSISHLTGPQRLAAGPRAMVDPAQWVQPRNGGEGLNDFIEGLGPGQIVGRQVLGNTCLGEIQMGLSDKKGRLEVEVIRAKKLVPKPGAKTMPIPYVKAYLMDGKNCVEKLKSSNPSRKTLDPFYNSIMVFMEPYMQKILQVMVWGDYGRMDRKAFMGVAQINLDDLELSNIVFGWYKLFTTSSIVASAGRRSSQSSLDSSYNSGSHSQR